MMEKRLKICTAIFETKMEVSWCKQKDVDPSKLYLWVDYVTSLTTGSKAARFSFLRSFSTKGSQAQLGQQNSLVSLDSYAFPTHEKSVTLSAATTRSKVAAMQLQASAGDGDEDALSPV